MDLRDHVRPIASLAGIDGAIVMTRDLDVLGFGAKIAVRSDMPEGIAIYRAEPAEQPLSVVPLESIGGTRHQSAARFIHAHRDAVALVMSQDRHLTVMHWYEAAQTVAALRNAELAM